MFLNSVRDEEMSADEAAEILNKFDKADEKVKNRIKPNFNNGEYTSPIDVLETIDIIEKTGIISKKDWAKKGLIKIAEDDAWIVTCTTNYEASKHYFGDTPWCTASDENGHDIPDWSEDDEMAVAKRNQQAHKEMGLNESTIKMLNVIDKLMSY